MCIRRGCATHAPFTQDQKLTFQGLFITHGDATTSTSTSLTHQHANDSCQQINVLHTDSRQRRYRNYILSMQTSWCRNTTEDSTHAQRLPVCYTFFQSSTGLSPSRIANARQFNRARGIGQPEPDSLMVAMSYKITHCAP
jgi:hypothetical protein